MAGTAELVDKLLRATEGLREASESLLVTQRRIADDIAEMNATVVEHTTGSAQLGDAVLTAIGKLGEMFDRLEELEARFGRYLQDQEKQQSGIRDVDKRLRLVENHVGKRE